MPRTSNSSTNLHTPFSPYFSRNSRPPIPRTGEAGGKSRDHKRKKQCSLAGNFLPGLERNIAEGMGYAVLFSGILFGSYIFMMAAMLDLTVRHLIKNTAILILVEWKTSLLLLGTLAVFWTFILAFMPYSIFIVVIIGFSFQQLMVCAWINPVVERRIIKPYEQKTYSLAS